MASKISHHIFVNGSPVCGNKGEHLVNFTSASPLDCLCGRCRLVQKARNPAALKALLERSASDARTAAADPDAPLPVAPVAVVEAAEAEAKAIPAAKPAKAPKAKREPKAVEKREVKTFLLDPVIVWKANGKVDTITGTCPVCKTAKRTIHAADAFQVKCCAACQKKAIARRVNEARKAKRAAAKKEAK